MRRRAAFVLVRTRRCAGILAILDVLCACPVLAQQAVPLQPLAAAQAENQTQDEKKTAGDGRRTVARLPANLARGAVGIFSAHNLRATTIGTWATGASFLLDDEVKNALSDPDAWDAFDTSGRPAITATVLGAVFVAGRFAGGTRFRAASYDWATAYLLNAGYTFVLKEAVGRERPNGADNRSFPSGHTSNAFALAAVAERHYGWKVGIAAYGLAATVGLSRVRQNAHYLSDVVAGATLGHIVGRTVVRVNRRATPDANRRQVTVLPAVGPKTRALVIQLSF